MPKRQFTWGSGNTRRSLFYFDEIPNASLREYNRHRENIQANPNRLGRYGLSENLVARSPQRRIKNVQTNDTHVRDETSKFYRDVLFYRISRTKPKCEPVGQFNNKA
jgi:hypothetical protein